MNRRSLLALSLAAAAAPAAAKDTNRIVSKARPALTLEIDRAFSRLPPLAFPIEKVTNARREIFVQAGAQGFVERAVIIQFETVQPGSDFRFVYPSRPPQRFGAETYRFGAYVYDDEKTALAAPGKEAALTRAHMERRSLSAPRLWRTCRLARVTDPEGLTEVIIFYLENADADFPTGPLKGADEDGDLVLAAGERDAIFQRLRETIRVVSG